MTLVIHQNVMTGTVLMVSNDSADVRAASHSAG